MKMERMNQMKKSIAVILLAALCLSLCACGNFSFGKSTPTPAPTPAPTVAPTPDRTGPIILIGSGKISLILCLPCP